MDECHPMTDADRLNDLAGSIGDEVMTSYCDVSGARPADQALAVPATPAGAVDGPSGCDPSRKWGCPFDQRLARTPYFVLPKLALQSMPMEWRDRFDAMLAEMDETGMETPDYFVLRNERPYAWAVREDDDDDYSRIDHVEVYLDDPWANYRHGNIKELCPAYAAIAQTPSDTTHNNRRES